MKKVVRMIEVSKATDTAINRMAKRLAQTPSQIVSDAIERLQADYGDLSIEFERLAEFERTGEAIDLEDARKRSKAQLKARRAKPKVRLSSKAYV